MKFTQTYYALRQQVGPYAQERLKDDDLAFQRSMAARCTPDATTPPTAAQCVSDALNQQRQIWSEMLTGPAAEEAARPLEDHFAIQARLRQLGFLPATAAIDGVYGSSTRMAISTWQRFNGHPDTGFVADAEVKLLMAPPSPSAVPPLASDSPSPPPVESPPAPESVVAPVAPTIPTAGSVSDQESRFVATINDYAERYKNAANDMLSGATRPARAAALCQLMQEEPARDWIGTIQTLSSNNEGKGVLTIRISDDITISTWTDSFTDGNDRTLIPTASPLFAKVSGLAIGDHVRFSANLIPDTDDCFKESSLAKRLLITAFTVDSARQEEMRSPARYRSP